MLTEVVKEHVIASAAHVINTSDTKKNDKFVYKKFYFFSLFSLSLNYFI